MPFVSSIAEVAALIGDPARTNMLFALKDDGHVSAGDLSVIAGVAPSTTSEHLAKLTEAGLISVTARGRKRFYSIAIPEVADILEGLESVATTLTESDPKPSPHLQALIHARSCYDHLSGKVGTGMTMAFMERGFISHGSSEPYVTDDGAVWLARLNIDLDALRTEPRRFLRLCPDWSERSLHIGGSVGAAILRGLINFDWLRRERKSRKVTITPKGLLGFRAELGLDIKAL